MVKADDICNLNQVNQILDRLRESVKAMKNIYGEDSSFFNDYCEDVTFQICEIEEFILDKEIITNKSLANADIRMMNYWDYIETKMSFEKLLKKLKKYS